MDRQKAIRFGTLMSFGIIFESLILVASHLGRPPEITPLIMIAMIFAASLVGRALAYLTIFEWLRHPFTEVVAHSSGVGEDVHPITSDGTFLGTVREVVGTWICCPICAGTWGALGLMLFYIIDPVGGSVLVFTLGAASAGSILTRVVETVEWIGHNQHEQTGHLNRANRETGKEKENLLDFTHPEVYANFNDLYGWSKKDVD